MNLLLTAYARTDALSKGDSELFIIYSILLLSIYRKCVALWVSSFLDELQIDGWVNLHSI